MRRIQVLGLAATASLILALIASPILAQRLPSLDASPLAKYPGFGHNPEADEARFEQEETDRETRVVRCMERAGFTYWPLMSISLDEFESPGEAISALRDNQNDRYVANLSAEDKPRYYRALYGVDNPYAPEAERLRNPADPTGGGCAAAALRAIPGVYAAKSALTVELHEMRQAALKDQRVQAVEAQWSACMKRHGYSLTSPRALRQQMDLDLAQHQGARVDLKNLAIQHRAALEKSTECVQQTGFQAVVAAVRVDYETEFVKKHKAFLDTFLHNLKNQPLERQER
jgi:hypothetical protein